MGVGVKKPKVQKHTRGVSKNRPWFEYARVGPGLSMSGWWSSILKEQLHLLDFCLCLDICKQKLTTIPNKPGALPRIRDSLFIIIGHILGWSAYYKLQTSSCLMYKFHHIHPAWFKLKKKWAIFNDAGILTLQKISVFLLFNNIRIFTFQQCCFFFYFSTLLEFLFDHFKFTLKNPSFLNSKFNELARIAKFCTT